MASRAVLISVELLASKKSPGLEAQPSRPVSSGVRLGRLGSTWLSELACELAVLSANCLVVPPASAG